VIGYLTLSIPEAKFKINAKEGIVELEGTVTFVDKHLEKFEELFNSAIKEAIGRGLEQSLAKRAESNSKSLPLDTEPMLSGMQTNNTRHSSPKQSLTLPPVPVDLKVNEKKIGLREFYAQKKPSNHYERTAVFAYYLSQFNKKTEIKYGELLSCYEEVDEKKPSIVDIVKNSIRYKGWLEPGYDKFSTRLTISGENFVKFDLPQQKVSILIEEPHPSQLSLNR
jgi:hypothetical protein